MEKKTYDLSNGPKIGNLKKSQLSLWEKKMTVEISLYSEIYFTVIFKGPFST